MIVNCRKMGSFDSCSGSDKHHMSVNGLLDSKCTLLEGTELIRAGPACGVFACRLKSHAKERGLMRFFSDVNERVQCLSCDHLSTF